MEMIFQWSWLVTIHKLMVIEKGKTMTTQEILSQFMYPGPGSNIRTKALPLYHNLTLAAGTLSYPAFTPDVAYAVSNIKLPLSGSQMFCNTGIRLRVPSLDGISVAELGALLFNCYLTLSINDRLQVKLPLSEFINFPNQMIEATTQTLSLPGAQAARRVFAGGSIGLNRSAWGFPYFFNSNSKVVVTLELTTAVAAFLDGAVITLILDGWLADKLDDVTFQELAPGDMFQTMKDSIWVASTYQSGVAGVDLLQTAPTQYTGNNYFPLSNINNAQIEAIELGIATDQDFATVENALATSFLTMMLNDVLIFEQNLLDMTSIFVTGAGNFTDTNADTIAYSLQSAKRKILILQTPILIPPLAKVITQVTFATAAALDTNPLILDLQITGQRRIT